MNVSIELISGYKMTFDVKVMKETEKSYYFIIRDSASYMCIQKASIKDIKIKKLEVI